MHRARILTQHLLPSSLRTAAWPSFRQSAPTRRILIGAACASSFSTKAASTVPLLPPQSARDSGRLTVVLDMDETLLHSHLAPLPPVGSTSDPRSMDDHQDPRAAAVKDKKPVDFTFEIGVGKNDTELVKSTLRPGVLEFLHALSAEFEPVLFTSAMEIYASPLLDKIDSDSTPKELKPLWRHRIYRPGTVMLGQFGFVKDISRLGRPMERIVLIDNSWAACVANPDNSIVVPDYLGEKEDRVLARVLEILRIIKDEKDVRPKLIQMVKYREQITKAGVVLPGDSQGNK
jgi:RNA polymerase II subunit A small phosphatase-like protein